MLTTEMACYRSVVCLFVSLSITFVHCAQTAEDIDTISSAYDNSMSLPDGVKTQFTSVNTFSPKFGHKLTHPCWFERQRHSMANLRPNGLKYRNGHNGERTGNHR